MNNKSKRINKTIENNPQSKKMLLFLIRNGTVIGTLLLAIIAACQSCQNQKLLNTQKIQLENMQIQNTLLEKQYRESYRPIAHSMRTLLLTINDSKDDSLTIFVEQQIENISNGVLLYYGGICYYSNEKYLFFKDDLFNNKLMKDNFYFDGMSDIVRGIALTDTVTHTSKYEPIIIGKEQLDKLKTIYIYTVLLYRDQASDYWYGTIVTVKGDISSFINKKNENIPGLGKENYFVFTNEEIKKLIEIIQHMGKIRNMNENHNLIDYLNSTI